MTTWIGFRVKFDDQGYDKLRKDISNYSNLFARFEIKVTESFKAEAYVKNIVDISKRYLKENFSFHLPKDMLTNKESMELCLNLASLLKEYDYKGNLVTHIPKDIKFPKYENALKHFLNVISKESTLVLENEVSSECERYLNDINVFCCDLAKNGINNAMICIDFGHLMFGITRSGKSQKYAIELLNQYPEIIKRIKHIHLHDFNMLRDHLHIGEGKLDMDIISDFTKFHNLCCPIIIETNINDPYVDGIQQLGIVKKFLH